MDKENSAPFSTAKVEAKKPKKQKDHEDNEKEPSNESKAANTIPDDSPIIAAINHAAIQAETAAETTQNMIRAFADEQNE